jgi:hypothetical protein
VSNWFPSALATLEAAGHLGNGNFHGGPCMPAIPPVPSVRPIVASRPFERGAERALFLALSLRSPNRTLHGRSGGGLGPGLDCWPWACSPLTNPVSSSILAQRPAPPFVLQ